MCNSRNSWTTFWSGFPLNIHTNDIDVSPYIHQYLQYLHRDMHFLPHSSLLFSIMSTVPSSCSNRCMVIKSSFSIPWRLEKLNIFSCICHSHIFSEMSLHFFYPFSFNVEFSELFYIWFVYIYSLPICSLSFRSLNRVFNQSKNFEFSWGTIFMRYHLSSLFFMLLMSWKRTFHQLLGPEDF